jgi:hypothetical protein
MNEAVYYEGKKYKRVPELAKDSCEGCAVLKVGESTDPMANSCAETPCVLSLGADRAILEEAG